MIRYTQIFSSLLCTDMKGVCENMLNKVKSFIITFFISLLIFGSIAYFIVNFALDTIMPATNTPNDFEGTDNSQQTTDIEQSTGDTNNEDTNVSDDKISGTTFSVLLVGTDHQPSVFNDYDIKDGTVDEMGFPVNEREISADFIMLMQVNKELGQFIFTPFYGNTRLTVNGSSAYLSEIYDTYGINFMCEQVRAMTGLPIDYYAIVSIDGIVSLIDDLDGIEYSVPVDMHYEDPEQNLLIDLKAGKRVLSGEEVMQMLRYNSYASDDSINRTTVSLDFLKALLTKFSAESFMNKAVTLYSTVIKSVNTNFSADDLFNNIDLVFSYPNYESVTVSYPGNWSTVSGVQYFVPNINSGIKTFSAYKNLD